MEEMEEFIFGKYRHFLTRGGDRIIIIDRTEEEDSFLYTGIIDNTNNLMILKSKNSLDQKQYFFNERGEYVGSDRNLDLVEDITPPPRPKESD